MQKLFVILFLLPLNIYSQQLESFMSFASFNSDQGPFLETYLSFNVNTLILTKNTNNLYNGEVDISITLYGEKDQVIFHDRYILESPEYTSNMNNNIFFIDQQRIKLNDGGYNLIIKVKDVNSNFIKEHNRKINISYQNTSLSDIQLIDHYYVTDSTNFLTKSGYVLTPFVLDFYSDLLDTLSFYFEIYNTNLLENNRYLLNSYISSSETDKSEINFYKRFRQRSSLVESKLLKFDISELPTGNYYLICELRDIENQLIVLKKIFFQRSKKDFNIQNNIDVYVDNSYFTKDIINKDTLKQYIDYLYPISKSDESVFAENQLKYDDLDLMQRYFFDFWKKRNPINPLKAWQIYYLQVQKVNVIFKNQKKKGYLTDRGRVYLQYGSPNTINKADDPAATYPYEIWHYYKLKNQSNKKFVFVNSNPATNEYRLEYSNVDGEVSNLEWIRKIEQSQISDFGNDFNNDYINPK